MSEQSAGDSITTKDHSVSHDNTRKGGENCASGNRNTSTAIRDQHEPHTNMRTNHPLTVSLHDEMLAVLGHTHDPRRPTLANAREITISVTKR